MKPPLIAAAAILPIVAALLAGCAPMAASYSSKPVNSREYVEVREIMIHVDVKEPAGSIPNPLAAAGFAESVKDWGYSELVFVGLNTKHQPIFRRRDLDVVIKETPDHRMYVQRLPEKTTQFTLDYSKGRLIAMRKFTVEIIEATLAGVTFTVY